MGAKTRSTAPAGSGQLAGLIIFAAVVVLVILFAAVFFYKDRQRQATAAVAAAAAVAAEAAIAAEGALPNARLRRRRLAANNNADEDGDDAAAADGNDNDNDLAAARLANIGGNSKEAKRQAAKTAKKEQKAARRAAMEADIDARERRKDAVIEAMHRRDDDVTEVADEAVAERRAAVLVRQRADDAVFDAWKGSITVDGGGDGTPALGSSDGGDDGSSDELLASFVAHLRAHKVTPLVDLARRFNLKTADVVARIRALESAGQLSGVLDERGKYVRVDDDEMHALAAYINDAGRVSIDDVRAFMNRRRA
jgi:hypothetical protein